MPPPAPSALESGPDLPDEILHEIFSILAEPPSDTAALKACSLATKRLLHFARIHLFSKMDVGRTSGSSARSSRRKGESAQTFFVENPHLISYIHTLTIHGDFVRQCESINDVDAVFWTNVTHLQSLSLLHLHWSFLNPTVRNFLLKVDVVNLTMNDMAIDPSCGFLCTFPSLRSVDISLQSRPLEDDEPEKIEPKHVRPAKLSIEFGTDVDHLLHPLLDLTGLSHLRLSLRLKDIDEAPDKLKSLLDRLAESRASVHVLEIEKWSGDDGEDLSESWCKVLAKSPVFSSVEQLSFKGILRNRSETRFLSGIRTLIDSADFANPSLRKIEFGIEIFSVDDCISGRNIQLPHNLATPDWEKIDTALASKAPNLKELNVSMEVLCDDHPEGMNFFCHGNDEWAEDHEIEDCLQKVQDAIKDEVKEWVQVLFPRLGHLVVPTINF